MVYLQRELYGKCNACDGEGQRKVVVSGEKILMLTTQNMDNKIEAIKSVRNAYTILGLKEAKDLVEHSMEYINSMRRSLQAIDLSNKTV